MAVRKNNSLELIETNPINQKQFVNPCGLRDALIIKY